MTDLVTIGLLRGGKDGVELDGVGKRIVGLPVLWVSVERTDVSGERKGVDVGMGDISISAFVSLFLLLAMPMPTMIMMMMIIITQMTMSVIMVVSKR